MKTLLLKKMKVLLFLFLIIANYTNAQQIDIFGNGNLINNGGGNSPAINNQSNFGSTNENAGIITKVFTITNNAVIGNLTLGSINIGGANASEFVLTKLPTTPVSPFGGTTTFEINFNPVALGLRVATFSIATNVSGKNPYTFNLSGTGTSFASQSYTLFYENFDANNGGWTAASTGGSSWLYTNTPFRGEGNYWLLGDNYTSNTKATLTSPVISSAGYTNIRVSLDIRYETLNDTDDGMQIQYSINGGSSWIVLGAYVDATTWYNSNNVIALNSSLASTTGFSGSGKSGAAAPFNEFFEKSTQSNDLDNKANLRFRIVFNSDGGNNDIGVAIDNFFVKGDPITAFTNKPLTPGNVPTNLKLWLKANLGTSTTSDGATLAQWNDQAIDNDAKGIGAAQPFYRDGTRNINYNPVIDFTIAGATSMRGKGGFHSQDYFVVVKSNNTIDSASPTRQAPISGRTSITTFHLDGTAFALGNFTARYKNELVSHSISSVPQSPSTSSYGRAYATTTETYVQETTIYNVKTNAAGTSTEIYKNGKRIDNYAGESVGADQVTVTGILNFAEFNNIQYNLGVGRFSLNGNISSYLDGKLSEIISYSDIKSTADKNKIESYLAIKNGVTLHKPTSTTVNNLCDTNYLDSSGNIIWDFASNTGFNYDIAGIGRDDNTALNQKQSKSENPGTVLTIGLGDVTSTNNLNPNSFPTNRNFLVWGSNNGTMVNSGTSFPILLGPTTITTITEVVNRQWKVNEVNGDVPITRVAIPTTSFVSGLPALGATDAYVMLVATNAAFTTGVETVFMSTTGSNETCLYDFDGTKYITFGVAHRATSPLHITLDGFDDHIRIGDANELGATFSIMTWIRPDGNNTLANERTILAKTTATNGYKLVLQNDYKIRMQWTVSGFTQSLVSNTALPNTKWHNIAVTYGANTLNIFIDGVLDKTTTISIPPASTTSTFSIGAQYINKLTINNLWKGDIDELRMWNRVVSPTEIRFVMNQEILQTGTGTTGSIIPASVTKNDINLLLWNSLFAYYSMNSYIGTHLDDDSYNINRGSLVIPDKISISIQTAPMPYVSLTHGLWSNTASWKNGTIQDLPYSLSIINSTTPINWNIVQTANNIDSAGNKVLLGLFVTANTLTASNDTKIEVSHYLKLDGKIDLSGKSQLIQRTDSDLDPTSAGLLERDQQGQKVKYNYNYWSSPVGDSNTTTNNNSYTVANVMKDGTTSTPQDITWTTGLNGTPTSPITLSSYWIFKFQNLSNNYSNWQSVGQSGTLLPGQGYTLKGSGTALTNQNYTFVGKPNNGTITSPIAANNLNLAGNPYSSALDISKFISDNTASITGTLYFWEHYPTNNAHVLSAYQGGYATRNATGGTPPVRPPLVSNNGSSSRIPGQYMPVGQAFFVAATPAGGNIIFNNSQREFVKEDNSNSNILFKQTQTNKSVDAVNHFSDNRDYVVSEDNYEKVRLGFESYDGYHRQTLLGFMNELATSNVDNGYDAVHIDSQPSDMYFLNGGTKLIINGEGYYDINKSFPLGVKTNVLGEVKFMIDASQNFNSDQRFYIYDNVTNIYNDITTDKFTIELPIGTIENRFSLTFKNAATALATNNFDINDGIKIAYTNANSTLSINNNVVDTTVESVLLFNMLGQSIATYDVKNQSQSNITLPIKSLSAATYIVKIKTDKGDINRKIIIN